MTKLTYEQLAFLHGLLTEEDKVGWVQAANLILEASGFTGVVTEFEVADKIIRAFVQQLMEEDDYLSVAVIYWGSTMFDVRPKYVSDIFRCLRDNALILLQGASSVSKTYSCGAWCYIDWRRDPSFTAIKVAALSDDHLRKNIFSHIQMLHKSASIPLEDPSDLKDVDLYFGLRSAGNQFGFSGIAFKQSSEATGHFKGYKPMPYRKIPHPKFGNSSRIRILGDECVRGDQRISMADGSLVAIKNIVNDKIHGHVLSFNTNTLKIEPKRILGWHKVPLRGRGFVNVLGTIVTEDHPVLTTRGYIEAKLLDKSSAMCFNIDHEALQRRGLSESRAAFRGHWGNSWRCIYPFPATRSRKLSDEILARGSTARLSSVEAEDNGWFYFSRYQGTNRDRIQGASLFIRNQESPSVYETPQTMLRGREEEIHKGHGADDRSNGPSRLVHGRRQHVAQQQQEIWGDHNTVNLCASIVRCDGSVRLSQQTGIFLQSGQKQGKIDNTHQHQGIEELRERYSQVYSPMPEVQINRRSSLSKTNGDARPEQTYSAEVHYMWDRVCKDQKQDHLLQGVQSPTDESNSKQESNSIKDEEEFVYCIDVEDNHNFFAEGIALHNCQNWPEGPFKDFASPMSSIDGVEHVKIMCSFNPESVGQRVVQLAEPEEGWMPEGQETLYEWTSKEGWRVLRLDAKLCENVVQRKVIYPNFQTYEGFLKLLRGEGDVSSRYSCVDAETECMSKRGWLRYNQLMVGDHIYTLNIETGNAEWKEVKEVFSDYFDGELVSMEDMHMSALVTSNHKWAYTNNGRLKRRNSHRFSMKETSDLKKYDIIPLNRPSVDYKKASEFTDDFAAVIGWVVTDGTVDKRVGHQVTIYQSSSANVKKCIEIRNLLNREHALSWEQAAKDGMIHFRVNREYNRRIVSVVGIEKQIPFEFIESLTESGMRSLLEAILSGDGGTQGINTRYACSKNDRMADAYQFLISRLGMPSHKHKRHIPTGLFLKKLGYNASGCDMNYVNIKSSLTTKVQYLDIKPMGYHGIVWCPRTDNGTFLARRNGITYFTGNTFARGWPPLRTQNWTVIPPAWPSSQRGEAIFDEIICHCASIDCAYQGMDKVLMAVGRFGIASGWTKTNGENITFMDPLNPKYKKSRPVMQFDQLVPLTKSNSPTKLAEEIRGQCTRMQIPANFVVVDGTGQGSGTASFLKEYWGDVLLVDWAKGASTMKILSEDQNTAKERYDGIISEMHFAFQKWLNPEVCAILIHPQISPNPINTQMSTRRWCYVKGGKQKVESKAEFKARNQRSPDEHDAMIMLPFLIRSRANVLPGMATQVDNRAPPDEDSETIKGSDIPREEGLRLGESKDVGRGLEF